MGRELETATTAHESTTLMRDLARGSDAALTRLVALHGRGLTIFATRYLGSASQAEDVVQEVFIRAWERARSYDPARGAVSTWLYRIAANLCIDRQRRARFRRFFGVKDVTEMADTLAVDTADTDRALAARETLARVRQGIAGLPDRQRMAILFAAVAGMDTVEIAAIMGASRGSVEQLLVRARRTLRAGLGEGGSDDG